MSTSSLSAGKAPSSPAPSFAAARARFPGTAAQAYLDVASRSLVPATALDIAAAHLRERVEGRVDKYRYFEVVESARARYARLIGAAPAEIAITKNVSEGLNIVAGAIDWRPGDEVLLCSAVEHPNNIYAWRNLERLGVRVVDLPSPDGLFPLAAAIDALKRHPARVVTVSGTSFRPGFRTDLDALGQACQRAGTLLVVDGAQSTGIMHLDVSRTPMAAMAASTQKGLCGLYGMGFLYVRQEIADALTPRSLARFGVDIAATHEADYDAGPLQYRKGALRFDLGNYNFLAAALVDDSLALLESYGTQAIDAHVTELATTLSEGLKAGGVPVVAPAGALASNIVCLSFQGKADVAQALQAELKSAGVHVAVRGSSVRYSMHLYNNMADMDRAIEATVGWVKRNAPGR